MNISITTTDEQDDAIAALRRRHNRANPGNPLTAKQWIERRFDATLASVVAEAAVFVGAAEVADAFKVANNAVQTTVKAALGL